MRRTACLALLLATLATTARARVEARSDYSKAQTFSGALRYLRVDLDYDVIEKDETAAYLLFKYPMVGKRDVTHQGSIEVIEAGNAVKLFVQMSQAPEYQERLLRDGLMRKLQQEYGAPPAKTAPAKNPEKAAPAKPAK